MSASGPASCSASLDLARAFCLLPGGASGSVVVLEAKGEVGRFDVPGEMKDLRADGEGLVPVVCPACIGIGERPAPVS